MDKIFHLKLWSRNFIVQLFLTSCFLNLLFVTIYLYYRYNPLVKREKTFTWSKKNAYSVDYSTNKYLNNCTLNPIPKNYPNPKPYQNISVCCDVLDYKQKRLQIQQEEFESIENYKNALKSDNKIKFRPKNDPNCYITRTYYSSPYELRHLKKSYEIIKYKSFETRQKLLIDFISSHEEILSAKKWLARVNEHKRQSFNLEANDIDREYLSKYIVTKICNDREINQNIEWIEPLTVHARHPIAFLHAAGIRYTYVDPFMYIHDEPLVSAEYVLVKSKQDLLYEAAIGRKLKPPRSYFFDIGTSTFDSSLVWFLCTYFQRNIDFDHFYGWELSLLNPNHFWKVVPKWLFPKYHFYNVGIQTQDNVNSNILRIIEQITVKNDFVSLKLDIDHPRVEIPVVLEMIDDPKILTLVDEFFFELHFNCEVMYKWWDVNRDIPKRFMGLELDRPHALELFLKMRQNGIRAHFWP